MITHRYRLEVPRLGPGMWVLIEGVSDSITKKQHKKQTPKPKQTTKQNKTKQNKTKQNPNAHDNH